MNSAADECACKGFEHEHDCSSDGLKKSAPSLYSMRFPHKQTRRSQAIRRLYDRHIIDDERAAELLRPISKMRDGCWAAPFNPAGVVELWASVRPISKATTP